jgi:hypothetical protein
VGSKIEIFQEFLEFVRAPGAAMDETEFCKYAGLSEDELQGILDLVAKVEQPDNDDMLKSLDEYFKDDKGSRGYGAGKRSADALTIPDDMSAELWAFMINQRGRPPANVKYPALQFAESGHRTRVRIRNLVDHLKELYPDKYRAANIDRKTDVWYFRVYRWCLKHKIVYRKPNWSEKKKDKDKLASQVLGTLERIRDQLGDSDYEELCNFDEFSCRLFGMQQETLDYQGNKKVALDEELLDNFALSVMCAYFARTGHIEFIVMWSKAKRKDSLTGEMIPADNLKEGDINWTNENGTWFAQLASSSWTRKAMYCEIIQHLHQQNADLQKYSVMTDDDASGHKGTGPDHASAQETPPIRRTIIQGGNTPDIATADQGATNFAVKSDISNAVDRKILKSHMEGERAYFLGYTQNARTYVGTLLSEIAEQWDNSAKRTGGTKKTFRQTLAFMHEKDKFDKHIAELQPGEFGPLPEAPKPVAKLAEKLELATLKNLPSVYKPFGHNESFLNICPHCDHRFEDEDKLKKHNEQNKPTCWGVRRKLSPPKHRDSDVLKMDAMGLHIDNHPNKPPLGLVFSVDDEFGFITGHSKAHSLQHNLPMQENFWHRKKVKYYPPRWGPYKPFYDAYWPTIREVLEQIRVEEEARLAENERIRKERIVFRNKATYREKECEKSLARLKALKTRKAPASVQNKEREVYRKHVRALGGWLAKLANHKPFKRTITIPKPPPPRKKRRSPPPRHKP